MRNALYHFDDPESIESTWQFGIDVVEGFAIWTHRCSGLF